MDENDTAEDLQNLISSLNLEQSSYHTAWTASSDGNPDTASSGPADTAGSGQMSNARPSLFNVSSAPSLFSSGGPVTSQSLTADASSAPRNVSPPNASRPLASLSASSSLPRRTARFDDSISLTKRSSDQMPHAEKDVDDPTTSVDARSSMDRRDFSYTTPTALSRLLGTSTSLSRSVSYNNQGASSLPTRTLESSSASLPDHLYTRGLLGGRHSDITVVAFGHRYHLHRLLLDRAPFFTTALSEPWIESSAKEIVLRPEEIDTSITQTAFELALKRLYGCDIAEEEDMEAIGLFATGCWLEMQDLIDSSIESIMRQMGPENLSPLIKHMTANYYGRAGERILASAKAMLCRDGWEMPLRYWDGIPGDICREMIGGDGFFINGEWERWVLAKRLLDRRLRQKAVEAGLVDPGTKAKVKAPDTLGLMAVRFDGVYRQNIMVTTGRQISDTHTRWLALYTHPDIEPLLVLLDEGIHYTHLDFEQLQYIRQARDIFGLPVMPEKVITNALWMSMELRQRVLNARDLDMELGLSKPAEEFRDQRSSTTTTATDTTSALTTTNGSSSSRGKGKQADTAIEDPQDEMESGSWDGNGKPRKFWIPSTDCNIVMGGNAEPVITTTSASNAFQRHAARLSSTLQPEDVQWATDFAASPSTNVENNRPSTPARPGSSSGQPKPLAYTHFPPFRFAAEFPNPRLLKEKKRVYSRTVFYAGSLWNIYIQRVRSAKNPQLGVYLHRAKEREAEEVIGGPAGLAQGSVGSVDERIGLLEREMLLRSERRERRRGRLDRDARLPGALANAGGDGTEDTSGSGGDPDATLVSTGGSGSAASSLPTVFGPRRPHRASSVATLASTFTFPPSDVDSDNSDADERTSPQPSIPRSPTSPHTHHHHQHHHRHLPPPTNRIPTIPPYVDARPTIKTYFKIYSPSKGGRLLSVYESAPDSFNFSQSWGWKSSTLMLDEGFLGAAGAAEPGGEAVGAGKESEGVAAGAGAKGKREGKLRFMVVIGNL